MATLTEQLDAMLTLKSNWDGYNADPIDPKPLALAKDFVLFFQALERVDGMDRALSVHPTRVGGVQVVWRDETTDHELEIEPSGTVGLLHVDRSTGRATEETFTPPAERSVIAPGLLPQLVGFGRRQEVA